MSVLRGCKYFTLQLCSETVHRTQGHTVETNVPLDMQVRRPFLYNHLSKLAVVWMIRILLPLLGKMQLP